MGWADRAIAELGEGREVTVSPHGSSMTPRIKSGQKVRLVPLTEDPDKGDVVLVKVGGRTVLHLVTAVSYGRYQISNNHGHVNGWVNRSAIYGKADI